MPTTAISPIDRSSVYFTDQVSSSVCVHQLKHRMEGNWARCPFGNFSCFYHTQTVFRGKILPAGLEALHECVFVLFFCSVASFPNLMFENRCGWFSVLVTWTDQSVGQSERGIISADKTCFICHHWLYSGADSCCEMAGTLDSVSNPKHQLLNTCI